MNDHSDHEARRPAVAYVHQHTAGETCGRRQIHNGGKEALGSCRPCTERLSPGQACSEAAGRQRMLRVSATKMSVGKGQGMTRYQPSGVLSGRVLCTRSLTGGCQECSHRQRIQFRHKYRRPRTTW